MSRINSAINGIERFLSRNSTSILTGVAVAGVITSVALGIKATPQASALLKEYEDRVSEGDTRTNFQKVKDTVRVTWKCYIPTAGVLAVTIACIIGANNIGTRRQAALASAYTITEKAFDEYQNKVKEIVGKNKEQKVKDAIAEDAVASNPVKTSEILITGNGDVLCYDSFSGRYFTSSIETLKKAQNDINAQIINELYASQNDFYRLINLGAITYGEEFGWNTDRMLDLEFSTMLADDGRPCVVVNYRISPISDYYKIG